MSSIHVEVVAAVTAAAVAYLTAWRRAPDAVGHARVVAFACGLAGLIAALNGPIHELTERGVFSAHMLQHSILTLMVPPLLLLGMPAFMLDALLRPWLVLAPTRVASRLFTRPLVALTIWAVALVGWHLPAAYAAAIYTHGVHFLQHATLFCAAVLAWWLIASPSRCLPALPYAARLLYLFVFGMPMTIVAAMITGAERVLYPIGAAQPLDDQRLGGILMWVPSGIVPLVAFTAVFFRWAAAESDPADAEAATDAPQIGERATH